MKQEEAKEEAEEEVVMMEKEGMIAETEVEE